MKSCPKCHREYLDESLNFCLDDGEWLVDTSSANAEPSTALFSSAGEPSEPATWIRPDSADQTAILPQTSLPLVYPKGASSAEYIVDEIRGHKRAAAIAAAIVLVCVSGFGYWFLKIRGNSASAPIASIAVLPFQNKGSDADAEYLADGLTESLIYRLTQLPNLKVSPTSSVIRYKGDEPDIPKVAGELNVDAVMSGRIVQRGDGLTISVELVDARSDKLLWGEKYERKLSDLLATQREIASTITQKLQLKLSGNETAINKQYTDNNEAYQLYLRGRFHFAKRTKAEIEQSIENFQQAINLDPNFALAYVGIAESYSVIPSYPYASPDECMPKAKAAVTKALELDPGLPEAHTVAAMIAATYDWDWAKADSEFKRSLELDPNLAITHYRYAWVYLSPLGRHDEAVAEMRRAMELEPLSIPQGANFAAVLMYARRFDEALDQARKTYALDQENPTARNWMCHALNQKQMYAESLSISEPTLGKGVNELLAAAGFSYAMSGRKMDVEPIIERWRNAETRRYVDNYWTAITYAAMGDKDAAFAELDKAYKAHDWFMPRMMVDPFLDPLRGDPRFDEMVKRLKFPG
jgi:TolB-like protein